MKRSLHLIRALPVALVLAAASTGLAAQTQTDSSRPTAEKRVQQGKSSPAVADADARPADGSMAEKIKRSSQRAVNATRRMGEKISEKIPGTEANARAKGQSPATDSSKRP